MDLKQFCESDPDVGLSRQWVLKPFSIGEWSYATDGRLMVRIPRREDVPENPDAPEKARDLFVENPVTALTPVPSIEFPPAKEDAEECGACDGRGYIHDCPSCGCKCSDCRGTGSEQPWHKLSFEIDGVWFNATYLARIRDLPALKFGAPDPERPMRFVFDGGEGLLMPMRVPFDTNIKLSLTTGKV